MVSAAVAAGMPFERAVGMSKRELDGWTYALTIARAEAQGGRYDDETGEMTWPKPTVSDEEAAA